MLSLVIGGAGSGKSAFAESLCCSLPGRRVYLATMQAGDRESVGRIARHREMRAGKGFTTIERGLDLAGVELPPDANVLLEDLSNLLANEVFDPRGGGADAVRRGLDHLIENARNLTIVTNEIFLDGDGFAPETLQYMRDLADLNRALAARADFAAEIVCSLPNLLKGELP